MRALLVECAPSLNKGEMTIADGILFGINQVEPSQLTMFSDCGRIDGIRYQDRINVIDINKAFGISQGLRLSSKSYLILSSTYCAFEHLLFLGLYKLLGEHVFNIMRSNVWKEYVNADVILTGHDHGFLSGGFSAPLYFYPFYLPFFACHINKKVFFYGGGLAHFGKKIAKKPWWYRKIIETGLKTTLKYMSFITLRETLSYEYLSKIGVPESKMLVTADPAFLLQPEGTGVEQCNIMIEDIQKNQGPLIGFTITRKRARMAFPNLKKEESYIRHISEIAKAIDDLIVRLNATIVFLPHCIGLGKENDDRIIARDIRFRCNHKDNVILIENEFSAAELKGFMARLDLFIGERIHSVVNAMSMLVPSIVLTDPEDTRLDMFNLIHQQDRMVSIEELTAEILVDHINTLWLNKDIIRQELATIIPRTNQQAMVNGEILSRVLNEH